MCIVVRAVCVVYMAMYGNCLYDDDDDDDDDDCRDIHRCVHCHSPPSRSFTMTMIHDYDNSIRCHVYIHTIGAYVNIHSQSGYTPVIFAVQQGDLEAVQTLVKRYGADVDRQENDGW